MSNPKKKEYLLKYIIISIIILAVALLAPINNIIRLILTIISLIILSVRQHKLLGKNQKYLPLYSLAYLIAIILLDSICVVMLNKIPIYAINIINDNNMRVYNALGYQVWQCDKKSNDNLIIKPFYNKGYLCSIEEIENVGINELITSLNNNYEDYRNTYVKVTGKISKKEGQNYIEMKSYQEDEDNLNGYVTFSDTIKLAILFENNEDKLDVYDMYDEITVVGKIKNMETTNDTRTIYMTEAELVSKLKLDEYTVKVNSIPKRNIKDEKTLIHQTKDNDIYIYGIKDFVVTFDDVEYELPAVLSSNKLDIKKLIKDANNTVTDLKDPNNKTTLYKLEDYNIVVCDPSNSKDIIFTSPKLTLDDITCTIVE